MARLGILVAACLSIAPAAWAQTDVELRGARLVAAATALDRFRIDEPNASLARYTLWLTTTPDGIEATFAPDLPPLDTGVVYFGGSTIYGRVLHYNLSKDGRTIIRTSYGR